MAEIRSGIAKNANSQVSNPVAVHYLRVANVQDGYLDLSDMSQLTVSREDIQRYAVLPGDMLMNEGGDLDKLGRGALWDGAFSPCVHQNHVFVVRAGRALVPSYLKAWTASSAARRYFLVAGKQTTNLASINKTSLGEMPVALPPSLDEQQAIAAALTDADTLIESLEQLLAKKRQIKQGAMQELLTGQRRLPGFKGDWEPRTVGSLGRWFGGVTPSMRESAFWSPAEVPWVSSGDVKQSYLSATAYQISSFAVSSGAATVAPQNSVVLVARSGILRKTLPVALLGRAMAINQDIKALAPSAGVSPRFVLHALTGHGDQILAACMKSGTTVESIEQAWLKAFPLALPPLVEQEAIAAALSEFDAAIEALEAKLTKARHLKQAMMQALLTGRIRLAPQRATG